MTGVDLSARMIGLAQEEEHRAPLGIRYARASYTDLPLFAGASFDAVVSFMALMDGPRFDLAMAECFRVLRPGGRLAFSITHPCFITKGSRWIRNEQGLKVNWVVGNYFDSTRWVCVTGRAMSQGPASRGG
jgi:ubiquinone/menaquinone biosynthesis C-methylase UbiE